MLEYYFCNPRTLYQMRLGPFGKFIDELAGKIKDEGYSKWTARHLLKETAHFILRALLKDRIQLENAPVFLNKCGNRITRKGITRILESIYARAVQKRPSLREKHITPHVIRHTTAMHLLKSGVDINTIRLWLGHVSIETTHGYSEANLDMKRKALAKNEISIPAFASKRYHVTKDRLSFLEKL